jgi:hypothetical protein
MEPISKFFHDYEQYVYQIPNVRIIDHGPPPQKPFEIKTPDKSKKTKKDTDKQKEKDEKEE